MKNRFLFLLTAITMLILGSSDALRGIFTPLFTEGFGISVTQLGLIVSASYLGNIMFLVFGGMILDRFGIRRCQVAFMLLLSVSEGILFSGRSFPTLAIGFFLSLGISTLINTTINLYSDRFSDSKGLMYVNILFFIQGIGGSLSQFILSKKADSSSTWHFTLLFFIIMLVPMAILMTKAKGLEERKDKLSVTAKGSDRIEYLPLVLITITLGSYLIAEHGVGNYLIFWGVNAIGADPGRMGNALALFSAGIMLGRLLFSPFIDRIGEKKFLTAGLVLSGIIECIIFTKGLVSMTFFLGLCNSIVYPTLIAIIRRYVPGSVSSRATTIVIGTASILDIVFNLLYGTLTEHMGLGNTMMILGLFHFVAASAMLPMLFEKRKRESI